MITRSRILDVKNKTEQIMEKKAAKKKYKYKDKRVNNPNRYKTPRGFIDITKPVVVNAHVELELYEALRVVAFNKGISMAKLIRIALRYYPDIELELISKTKGVIA